MTLAFLFGGVDAAGRCFNDVWKFDFKNKNEPWKEILGERGTRNDSTENVARRLVRYHVGMVCLSLVGEAVRTNASAMRGSSRANLAFGKSYRNTCHRRWEYLVQGSFQLDRRCFESGGYVCR